MELNHKTIIKMEEIRNIWEEVNPKLDINRDIIKEILLVQERAINKSINENEIDAVASLALKPNRLYEINIHKGNRTTHKIYSIQVDNGCYHIKTLENKGTYNKFIGNIYDTLEETFKSKKLTDILLT